MIRRRWLRLGLAVALLMATLFAIRAVLLLSGWGPDPARPVEGWMTPRYLVRVYDIPTEALAPALGLTQGDAPRETLEALANRQGIPLPDLIARVESLRRAP